MSARTRQALAGAWSHAAADPGRRYPAARRARLVLDQSRASVARILGVDPEGVFFAADRPTAAWWALTGHLATHPAVVVSAVEDLTVLRTADHIAAASGRGVTPVVVPVSDTGRIDLEALRAVTARDPEAPNPPRSTVVVQDGNIEIGTRQDIGAIRDLTTNQILVTDLAAVAGRVTTSPLWDVAFAEARMWGGPPGVTVVAVSDPSRFRPRIPPTDGHGGVESTDPPVPLIAAAALALEDSQQGWAATGAVTDHLRDRVSAAIPDVTIAGDPHHRVPYLTMFSLLYVAADEMVDALGRRGWSVSSGASCTSDTHRPHHVLVAVGALTHGSLRVSVGPTTTTSEIDDFVADLAQVVAAARADAGALGL